jgi:SulP family sulfate permease
LKKNQSSNWGADLTAGLTTAIANIPDALASAILAGTNPVYGLYGLMVGTPVGALLTSSAFMAVAITSAMAYPANTPSFKRQVVNTAKTTAILEQVDIIGRMICMRRKP